MIVLLNQFELQGNSRIYVLVCERGGWQGRSFQTWRNLVALAERCGLSYSDSAMLDRITVDPRVCDGKPTIRGMRFTVDFVLKLLGDGYAAQEIVKEYPELELEDVYQAAKYGAWLASERTSVLT